MNRILFFVMATFSFLSALAIPTPHKQILVFRNSGEVNLFYTDSIQAISIENNDSLGLCQVFKSHGGVQYPVPVAEIDSVAFGSRNISELKPNVRLLKDETDIPHIKSYDGVSITYSPTTPASIIPEVGELLFYGQLTDLLPFGICARVTSIHNDSEGFRVNIETVDPSEIFSQYFYAGDSSDPELRQMAKIISRSPGYNGNLGSLNLSTDIVKAGISLDVEFTDVVFNIKQQYYHVRCILKPTAEIGLNIELHNFTDGDKFKKKYLEKTTHLSPIALVFVPSFDFAFFLNVEATLNIKLDLTREFAITYEWTRQNGTNNFSAPIITNTSTRENGLGQVKTYLQLDGELFTGLEVAARFGLIGDLAGAGVRLNAGPRFTGELGLGVLSNLSDFYSPETYAKGIISASLGIDYQPFIYYKELDDLFKPGFTTEPIGSKCSLDFLKQDFNLFPQFENTTCITVGENCVVSRSEVSEPIVYPVEVGFSVETEQEQGQTPEPIASAFLDETLDADNDEPVGLSYSFDDITLSPEKFDKTVIRPIFKYRNYTIKAAPSSAAKNMFYNYFTHASQSNVQLVGGAVDVRTKTANNTCVLIGNYFPRLTKNPLFSYDSGLGINIDTPVLGHMLYGTWQGQIDGEQVVLIFNMDASGKFNDDSFTFELNAPQAGDIKMKFKDSERQNTTYTIVNLTNDTLELKRKGKSAIYILKRL